MLDYGKALKNARKSQKYTQEEVAKGTGIAQPNISAWENNIYTPNIDFCVQLADFYGISLDELIGRDFEYHGNAKNVVNMRDNNGNMHFN